MDPWYLNIGSQQGLSCEIFWHVKKNIIFGHKMPYSSILLKLMSVSEDNYNNDDNEDNTIEIMIKINAILLSFIVFRSLLDIVFPLIPLTSLALLFLF